MNAIAQIKQTSNMLPFVANLVRQQSRQQCIDAGSVNVQILDGQGCIAIVGRFDFQLGRQFRSAYTALLHSDVKEVCIELSKVDYMDSSALGALLLLKERFNAANKTVVLLSTSSFVSRVLEVANFNKIFNPSHRQIGNPNCLS